MRTGDGLLARIRVENRAVTPAQLADLCRLAIAHGNGILEISARGNLQARGLKPDSASAFAQAVKALLPLETGLVIDMSPLAGDDPLERADPRPLAARIRDGARHLADNLGPKVSVVIDGCGQIGLTGLKADIRLVALDAQSWNVHLGGGKPQVMDGAGALSATLALLAALAALGPQARANDLFPNGCANDPSEEPQGAAPALQTLTGYTVPVSLPFGQMHGTALIALADAAQAVGLETLRVAPAHRLLLDDAPSSLLDTAAALGFVTKPTDPRLRVSACIGNDGCASGHIAARRIAARLAPLMPENQHLHVSGCTKGCAHPRQSDVTMVGRADGIGLVINGRAGDTPQHILDEAGLAPALVARQDAR